MREVLFAIAVAGLGAVAVSNVSKAAPIAPLPEIVTGNAGNLVQAHYYHHHYYPYRWHGHYYHHRYWRHHHWHYW